MVANSLNEIQDHIQKLKFKRRPLGGLDEADVWEKIRALDADYQNVFKLQHHYYKLKLQRIEDTYKNAKAQEGQ